MRWLGPVAVALAFLLQPVSAQSASEDDWYLPDDADDVVAGDSSGIPAAAVGSADLLGLAVNVRDGNVSFRVETAAPATEVPVANSVDYDVDFAVAGLQYRLAVQRLLYADPDYLGGPAFTADFLVYDAATEAYRSLLQPAVVPGSPPSSFEALVPLLELRGPDGLPLVSGRPLEAARLRSSWTFSEPSSEAPVPVPAVPAWTDSLPDEGTVEIPLVLPTSDATVRLSPSTVVKVSNGEPRLLFFATSATNTDSQALEVEVEVDDVPPWWQLRVGSPKLTMAAGETVPLHFVVQTLGRHQHGTFDEANFTLTDHLGRAASGSLRIDYHDVPQPSGHHPRVYVHSLGTYPLVPAPSATSAVTGYMNTLEEDERDTAQGLQNRLSDGAASWDVPLSPALQLGLLVDPEGPSQIALCMRQVGPPTPQPAQVWATIAIESETGEPAALMESETGTLELGDETACLELPLRSTGPLSIDPKPGQNLVLSAYARLEDPGVGLGTTRVHLMPGTWAHLPLHEYVEPLPQEDGRTISWSGLSEPTRVPFGNSSLDISLASSGDKPALLLLDVVAPLDWRIEFAVPTVEVPAGGEATVALRIHVPQSADLDRPVQAIVLATDERGQAVLGSLVLVPDAGAQAEPAAVEDAPAAGAPALALVLLGAILALRRRA